MHCVDWADQGDTVWHFVHGVTVACAPVSGNFVVLWLNVEGCHAVVLWQVVQSVEKPPDAWGGLVVPLKSV